MQTTIPVQLPADIAAILAAVAEQDGSRPAELAARVLANWIGRSVKLAAGRDAIAQTLLAHQEAARRLSVLQRWWDARRADGGRRHVNEVTDEFTSRLGKHGDRITRATLYNWEKRWQAGGIDALLDGRRTRREPRPATPFLQECLRLYRSPRRPTLAGCVAAAAATAKAKGWPVESYKAAQRFVASRGIRRPIERNKKKG